MTSVSGAAGNLVAAFRLLRVPGLGSVAWKRFCRDFGSAQAVLEADRGAWRNAGIPERLWPQLGAARGADVSGELARLEAGGGWGISVFDTEYPALLREIHDPPVLLFGLGSRSVLSTECVAVVGARRASRYGAEHAYRVAKRLAELGFTVVSGLAVGVDATAHTAALDAKGLSVGVLGSGTSRIYPSQHAPLAARLSGAGALVSECLPDEVADRVNFPRRNRIISGLCRGVVIVEAREDSGSLITAREALAQGREVFVVPGPAGGTNLGGHRLLAEGANWAEDGDAVARVLRPAGAVAVQGVPSARKADEIPEGWRPVWNAVGDEPRHVDVVTQRSGLPSPEVLGILLQLELAGCVRQLGGKQFCRTQLMN